MRRIWWDGMAVALIAIGVPASADAACSVGKIVDLPVMMHRMGPMVDVRIDGQPVRMIADSGAFFSMISPGSAQSLHLALTRAPAGFYVRGINGSTTPSVATVKAFTVAGVDIPRVQFLVGGNESDGAVGLLGQNLLGRYDIEYDLPHGMIRFMKSEGCGKANLAYWAADRPYSWISIQDRSPMQPHTIGTVKVNGVPVHATFDTGASGSILSLSAAARAGIRPDSPGVIDGGTVWGIGRKLVRTWIGPMQSMEIGDGEKIEHARIRFGDIGLDTEMLIGADFFIAHRIYVDNRDRRLFLTYEGGPMFNLKARFDGPAGKDAAPPATSSPEAPATSAADAESHSRDGGIAAARNDLDTALKAFSKAIEMAPREPRYLVERAHIYLRQGRPLLAKADLDEAIRLDPRHIDALLLRAELLMRERDKAAVLLDLDAVDRAADPAAMERLQIGDLYALAGKADVAIGQFDRWLSTHPAEIRRPDGLNGRCWARALANKDLDLAQRDCDAALRAWPKSPAFLDSRATVALRRGDFAKAIADYDAVLAANPKAAGTLYMRGIAKRRSGDEAGAKADIAAAISIDPHAGEMLRDYGF